ncbi:MAG: site-specific DNA-methyltransferase, partial [Chloroflexi bacterium]|nr:site-specific DNA-methyltransferase [Chloroflexota bacterium]
ELQARYTALCASRLRDGDLFCRTRQVIVNDDARQMSLYFAPESIALIWTSPPYANLLNRVRRNISRRESRNYQYGRIEQYSQDEADFGVLSPEEYVSEMGRLFTACLPLLKPHGRCVLNVSDMWVDNCRIPLHAQLIAEMTRCGYELRNVIIWDRTNIVNNVGIFGYPSNYITMGVTFEYILDFARPCGR